jgi:uncharacterized membrane protein YfcA
VNEVFHLTDAALVQLILVCFVAFSVSVLSGLAGYGSGLVLPAFLSPIVGITNVVPVMAVAMLFNNGARVVAFWRDIQWLHVRYLVTLGVPACLAGAYGYSLLSSRWVAILLGSFLLASVPLRRILHKIKYRLSPPGEICAGGVFGFINGGMTGTGIILVSILMSAGVHGAALIGTDGVVASIMSVVRIALFSGVAKLNIDMGIIGIMVGLCTAPGAFIARRLLNHIPMRIHAWVMETMVVIGAISLIFF